MILSACLGACSYLNLDLLNDFIQEFMIIYQIQDTLAVQSRLLASLLTTSPPLVSLRLQLTSLSPALRAQLSDKQLLLTQTGLFNWKIFSCAYLISDKISMAQETYRMIKREHVKELDELMEWRNRCLGNQPWIFEGESKQLLQGRQEGRINSQMIMGALMNPNQSIDLICQRVKRQKSQRNFNLALEKFNSLRRQKFQSKTLSPCQFHQANSDIFKQLILFWVSQIEGTDLGLRVWVQLFQKAESKLREIQKQQLNAYETGLQKMLDSFQNSVFPELKVEELIFQGQKIIEHVRGRKERALLQVVKFYDGRLNELKQLLNQSNQLLLLQNEQMLKQLSQSQNYQAFQGQACTDHIQSPQIQMTDALKEHYESKFQTIITQLQQQNQRALSLAVSRIQACQDSLNDKLALNRSFQRWWAQEGNRVLERAQSGGKKLKQLQRKLALKQQDIQLLGNHYVRSLQLKQQFFINQTLIARMALNLCDKDSLRRQLLELRRKGLYADKLIVQQFIEGLERQLQKV